MTMPDTDPQFLLPAPDEDSQPFWDGCARGELLMQACASCGRRRFPPRPMCPWCRSFDTKWDQMSGRATVWSYVVTHPPLLPAYAAVAPYNVVVVVLDDDATLRMVGNLVNEADAPLNSIDPATVRIGEAVQVVFDTEVDGIAMPRWVRT
jgi:uncharacterized OB-fold protein